MGIKKLLIGTTIATGIGLYGALSGITVFNGKMDLPIDIIQKGKFFYLERKDFNVKYEENKLPFSFWRGKENRMFIKDGDRTYRFYDSFNETNMDWNLEKRPLFKKDKLEFIVIEDKNETKKYSYMDIDKSTIQGRHVIKIFEECNYVYNKLREGIRGAAREHYKETHKKLEDSFLKNN